jgi:hypothetical protein
MVNRTEEKTKLKIEIKSLLKVKINEYESY